MKLQSLIFYSFLSLLFLTTSCIKDEPLYSEVDIEMFDLDSNLQLEALPARDGAISVILSDTAGVRQGSFIPKIRVSSGATVTPSSGESVTFDNYQARYIVTSEDKKYTREYVVSLIPQRPLDAYFEEWTLGGGGNWKYPAMVDNLWSSANPGIAIATTGRLEEYPTRPTTDCYRGKYAAMLETLEGGVFFGKSVPIFSGSLYRGKFELTVSDFVKSALFGQLQPASMGKPSMFTGYYKYTPGEVFTDENKQILTDVIDEFSAYAVLYKIAKNDTSKASYLTAYNILTAENIVATAILEDRSAKDSFTRFEIPFTYTAEPDYDSYDYRLAVVFSSSKEGDFYRGAIGSKLIVDNVKVICESY